LHVNLLTFDQPDLLPIGLQHRVPAITMSLYIKAQI